MPVTLNDIVTRYLAMRSEKEAIEKQHKDELRPIKESMEMLEAAMQKLLDEQGQKSASFAGVGTCYKQKWTKAKVTDWEATLQWMQEHERWDLLTQAVNKTVVIEEMTQVDPETGETTLVPCPIPGVEVDSGWKVNVRRS